MKYLILLLLFSKTFIAFSQNYGTLRGRVTDENINNEPVAYANVAVYRKYTGTNQELELELIDGTTTDEFGEYYIPNISAGTYTIEVTHTDLPRAIRINGVQIKSNGFVNLDIKYPIIDHSKPPTAPYKCRLTDNGFWVGSKIAHR
jgi:Carboxypeptidase regulatory-like domain